MLFSLLNNRLLHGILFAQYTFNLPLRHTGEKQEVKSMLWKALNQSPIATECKWSKLGKLPADGDRGKTKKSNLIIAYCVLST
jgi:hypothetical protein